jgi:agmatinase
MSEPSDAGAIPGDAAFRRKDLMGTTIEATYAGALSFMRRKYSRDLAGVDIAVTGTPFDQAVTNRPGTRFGPQAIRRASAQFAWGPYWPWNFDPFDTLAVVDYGDCFFDWGRKDDVPGVIEAHIAAIVAAGASSLVLGGDHFIAYPVMKAYARVHGPLSLIQFDAHCDVEPDAGGRIDHGTMFSLAIRDGIIDPKRSIQVGIRTSFLGEEGHGMTVIDADEVHATSADAVAAEITRVAAGNKAYLSFDIDCLNPAFAPGTGTPVPGGLTSHQALSIMRRLKAVDFAAMDLVEVSPPYDHAEITALAACALTLEYLCLRAWQKGARAAPVRD